MTPDEKDDLITDCISDVQAAGDDQWAGAIVEAAREICSLRTETDIDKWDGKDDPPLDVVENLCLNECSGNGVCNKGVCKCDADFTGADCSEEVGKPPRINSEYVHCDLSKSDCKNIVIEGEGFVDSKTLACKFIEVTVRKNQKWIVTNRVKTSLGTLIVEGKVQCAVPDMKKRYVVTVTNDGEKFSTKVIIIIIFNPICIECNKVTGWCTQRPNGGCFINNLCFASGVRNPADDRLECQPSTSSSSWSVIGSMISFNIIDYKF